MTYQEKLKDPRWQRRKSEVLNAANWRCQHCCRSDGTLHAHHLFYLRGRQPWEYPDELLVCLCDSCHDEKHKAEDQLFHGLAMRLKMVPGKRMLKLAGEILGRALESI